MFLLKIIFQFVPVWKCFFYIYKKMLLSWNKPSKLHFDKTREWNMIAEWDKLNILWEKNHTLSMLGLFNRQCTNK